MSDVAAIIADLIRAGTDPDLVGRVAAAFATREHIVVPDAAAERRREKDKERKRLRNSAEIGGIPPSPLAPLDKSLSPIPPIEIKPPYTPYTPQPHTAFAAFWAAFPNKVGKADASKAFDRATKRTSMDVLMAGLAAYAAKTDDRPWCNPATWLNQDRWTDVPAIVARGSPPKGPTLSERFAQLGQFANERQNGNDLEAPQQALRLVPPSPADE